MWITNPTVYPRDSKPEEREELIEVALSLSFP